MDIPGRPKAEDSVGNNWLNINHTCWQLVYVSIYATWYLIRKLAMTIKKYGLFWLVLKCLTLRYLLLVASWEYKLEDTKLIVLQGMNNEAVDVSSTVSYTHLDVYKRQRYTMILIGMMIRPDVLITKNIIIGLEAVSLFGFSSCSSFIAFSPSGDVYKRQLDSR